MFRRYLLIGHSLQTVNEECNMSQRLGFVLLITLVLALVGCSKQESAETADAGKTSDAGKTPDTGKETASAEPDYISVQHILVGFTGTVPGKSITRSQEEAQALAEDVFKRAQAGEDFDVLVKEYTDDSHPGIYKMANFDVPADMSQRVFARSQMVKAFGDVGFPLEVGEIGMASYDPETSQFGWHVIKRVE